MRIHRWVLASLALVACGAIEDVADAGSTDFTFGTVCTTLQVGQECPLELATLPSWTLTEVQVTSSLPQTASVSAQGVLLALTPGTTVISASARVQPTNRPSRVSFTLRVVPAQRRAPMGGGQAGSQATGGSLGTGGGEATTGGSGATGEGGGAMADWPMEGFAAAAAVNGGAGGKPVVVTNLNSTGEGSLQAAIESTGDRVITFTPGLSGRIRFTNAVSVNSPNMTLDGTGADITITGFSLNLYSTTGAATRNIIVRNLAFADTEVGKNAIDIEYGSSNLWIDHCTFSNNSRGDVGQAIKAWEQGARGLEGITLSWNKFMTPNTRAVLLGSETTATTAQVSMHHNWFDGVSLRNPRVQNGIVLHMWNNYVSNWGSLGLSASTRTTNVLSENDIFERNGGAAVNPQENNSPAASVNVVGSMLLGSPLPTVEQVGAFPRNRITYSISPELADASLKEHVKSGAGRR